MRRFRTFAMMAVCGLALTTLSGCDDLRAVATSFLQKEVGRLSGGLDGKQQVDLGAMTPEERAVGGERLDLAADYPESPPLSFVPGEIIMKPLAAAGAVSFRTESLDGDAEEGAPAAKLASIRAAVDTSVSKMGIKGRSEIANDGTVVFRFDQAIKARASAISMMRSADFGIESSGAGPSAPAAAPQPIVETTKGCDSASEIDAANKGDLGLMTECAAKDLAKSGRYEYVELNYMVHTEMEPGAVGASISLPNDPLFGLQWDLRDPGAVKGKSPGGAGFLSFWSRFRQVGSKSVVVAVIDTGIDFNHPDIAKSTNIGKGFDFVSDPIAGNDGNGRDANPQDEGDKCESVNPKAEDSFHGTHVAGTIGAANTGNGEGIAGGAWNITVLPVRAVGKCGGKLTDIVDAVRWAAGLSPAYADGSTTPIYNKTPANIINMSLGFPAKCPLSLQTAIKEARAKGVIIVAAAGNAKRNTNTYSPASCEGLVVVAASDARGVLTPYSNFGKEVTIMAPGGDLKRDDDKDNRPDGIISTKRTANCKDPVTQKPLGSCFYAYEMGTSMAAPHVTAALALLKAQYGNTKSSDELVALLTKVGRSPRTQLQCAGECTRFQSLGATPIPGSPDQCYRPCGAGLLDLSRIGGN